VTRPTRETTAGRAYLDLQWHARRDARPFDELLVLYMLEGFLARLASSARARKFVLKGGLLLAAYGARRPTRDADLAARHIANDADEVTRTIQEIAAIPLDDGLLFDIDSARGEVIRDEDAYSGVRVHLDCRLATAKTHLKVDVNIGDPITPAPEEIHVPRLLDETETIDLVGYPLPMVYAEKIVTALQRGTVNTRWRDFADIYLLSRQHSVEGDELGTAITTVAQHRDVEVATLSAALGGYADVPGVQGKWAAWRRKQELDDRLPESFSEVLTYVYAFADPALTGDTAKSVWRPSDLIWGTTDRPAVAPR
jgi:hypothetical protein